MIQDPVLRWIVTALFVLTAAQIVFSIAVGHRKWPYAVGHLLHLAMSVAMAVMAWPRGAALSTGGAAMGAMVFFLLAAVWFVAVAITGAGHRIVSGYSALMMVAMAWMYTQMGGLMGPDTDGMTSMSGMADMDGMEMSGGHSAWVGAVNWMWTILFATAALCWIVRYATLRTAAPTQSRYRALDPGWQAMMAAGMAIMFGVML